MQSNRDKIMNYIHSYHAGGFADVLKHWLQTLCLQRLMQKTTPLAMIDTHAGFGIYDLQHAHAKATEEFKQGIAKLFQATQSDDAKTHYLPRADVPESFQCYLELVRQLNHSGCLQFYPGSSEICNAMHRPYDNIHLLDANKDAYLALRKMYAQRISSYDKRSEGDKESLYTQSMADPIPSAHRATPSIHVHHANAYQHVLGLLPPPERRGFVIIDPPFESPREFQDLLQLMKGALARFEHGCYFIWYPIKQVAEVLAFKEKLKTLTQKPMLCIEAWLCKQLPPQGLAATGVIIINPPYGVQAQAERDLPWLLARFSQDPSAQNIVKAL